MALLVALLALALGFGPHARAPNVDLGGRQSPDIFELLEGRWTGSGTLLGRPAEFQMRWTRVLGQRFARLEFENAFLPADTGPPTPVLSAIAIYPLDGPAPRSGHWFDSRGAMLALTITPGDSALHVAWEGAGERGRTVYRVVPAGIVVVDSVAAAGGWREFGRATYVRSEAGTESSATRGSRGAGKGTLARRVPVRLVGCRHRASPIIESSSCWRTAGSSAYSI